jgi:hypothetical protein
VAIAFAALQIFVLLPPMLPYGREGGENEHPYEMRGLCSMPHPAPSYQLFY